MTSQPKQMRKRIISNPKAQFNLVSIMGGIFVLTSVIVCVLVYFQLKSLLDFFYHSPLPPSEYAKAFEARLMILFGQIFVSVSVMCAFFVFSGLYLSHRFTGPIEKLTLQLTQYLSSDSEAIPTIRFRSGDHFQDLPELINQVLRKR